MDALRDPTTSTVTTEPASMLNIIKTKFTSLMTPAFWPKADNFLDIPRDYPCGQTAKTPPRDPFELQTLASEV